MFRVNSKQKNVPEEKRGQFGYGDVWTWTAIDADTKLIVSWYLGRRDGDAAYAFMTDLADRLANRVQLTTDGHHAYLTAVDAAFDRQIDYAMLVKQYGTAPEAEKRYSPPICLGAERQEIRGLPAVCLRLRLTYMSILDEIKSLCNHGDLQLLKPIGLRVHLVPIEQWRRLYVTKDLAKYFETPQTPQSLQMYAALNTFILGQEINIALVLDHFDCRMARLDPARDDVWEVRSYEHNPQLRLFGRFAMTDVFIAMHGPINRNAIRGRGFTRAIDECLEHWRTLFGFTAPEVLAGC